MTQWYSDHFSHSEKTGAGYNGNNVTTLPSPLPMIQSAGISHGRIRYKRASITGLPLVTTPDVLRFFSLKSSDRLLELYLSCDGGSTAGAVSTGLHEAGSNHDGAVVDADLFDTAQSIASALNRQEAWAGGALANFGVNRGSYLWQQAAVGAASYTEDPKILFDVTCTVTTSFTVADSELVLEAYYTAGD